MNAELDERILAATSKLLAASGFDGTSIEAVAAEAGVGKASIYRRWPGKAELVLDAMRARGLRTDEPVPDTGSLRGDLLELLGRLQRSLGAEGMAQVAGVLTAMRGSAELTRLVHEQLLEHWMRSTSTILERAADRGEIPPRPPASVELVSQVAPSLMSLRMLASLGSVDEAFVERVVDEALLPILAHDPGPV